MKAVETDINESTINEQQIWLILQEVKDPDAPVHTDYIHCRATGIGWRNGDPHPLPFS